MGITENNQKKYLGLDIGTRRVGVALSDLSKKIAFPYSVISSMTKEGLLDELNEIILKENIESVIIGDPINIQGKRSSLTDEVHDIIDFLKDNLENADVKLNDERYSTKMAEESLHRVNIKSKKQKKIIDKVAAAIILQRYLDKQ